MLELERRYTRGAVEYRAATRGGGPGTLAGYAAAYERLSQNLGGYVERIMPGAFDKSIADGLDVLARYNHNDSALLGRTSSRTLRLNLDERGLAYEVDLPDTSVGRDVAALAHRGDLRHSSFAFYAVDDDWSVTESGYPLRSLRAARLLDVAPVNTPAYLDTSVALRSLADRLHTDLDEVREYAERNTLAELIHDLPAGNGDERDGQRATHPVPLAVHQRQVAWRNRRD